MDGFDDGLLIELVEKHDILYSKKNPLSKNTEVVASTWHKIGRAMGYAPDLCSQRWINLRNRYAKERRKVSEMPSDQAISHWPHYEQCGFLNSIVKARRTLNNFIPIRIPPRTHGMDGTNEEPPPPLFEVVTLPQSTYESLSSSMSSLTPGPSPISPSVPSDARLQNSPPPLVALHEQATTETTTTTVVGGGGGTEPSSCRSRKRKHHNDDGTSSSSLVVVDELETFIHRLFDKLDALKVDDSSDTKFGRCVGTLLQQVHPDKRQRIKNQILQLLAEGFDD